MTCTIEDFGFTVNGKLIGTSPCSAPVSQNIGIEADVSFDSASTNQQVYCYFVIGTPDGKTSGIYANNGNPISIGQSGTYTFAQDKVVQSSSALGLYKLLSVTILNSTKTSTICWTASSAYGCTQLTANPPPSNAVVYDISTTPSTIQQGSSFTINASIANSSTSGNVRAIFKVNGSQISDQNSTLNTYPSGGLWKPTANYTMPSSTITITVEAYGYDGTNWILTDTKSITRSPSLPSCSGVTLTPYSSSINIGDKVNFTASVTPSTSTFTVQFKDRSGTILGSCITSGGACQFVWDSTGKSAGTYYVTAYVVEGGCYSTESTIQLAQTANQWKVDIYVLDSTTSKPVSSASVKVGTQTAVTDYNGHVQFTVSEGTISISISKTGYNTYSTSELVFANKSFTYHISPLGMSTGSINFVSVPTGAEIFIDNIDQNTKTNATISSVITGNHTFNLKLSGYNDFNGIISVKGGATVNVYAVLSSLTTNAGSLYITSDPDSASVILDGHPQNVKTPANITNLPVGSHDVTLTKTGYQDYIQTVSVSAGTTTYLSATLSVLSGTGTLSISSDPSGGKIFIDDVDTQKVTPATISNLIAGDHTFRIELSGYNTESGIFTIVPGNTTQASVTLTKSGISTETMIGVTVVVIGAAGLYIALKEHKTRKSNGG